MTLEAQTPDAPNTTDSATSTTASTPATVADTTSQNAAPSAPTTDATSADTTATPSGAPEKYEFAAPEGVTFSDSVIGKYSEVAKELDLPQDKAQLILDKMQPAIAAHQAEVVAQAKTQWADDSKADKEFGGDKLQESLAVAFKARDAFASPELRALLDETGLGNHPEVIRMFYRAGKAISEDTFTPGRNAGGSTPPTLAQRMYPNMNP